MYVLLLKASMTRRMPSTLQLDVLYLEFLAFICFYAYASHYGDCTFCCFVGSGEDGCVNANNPWKDGWMNMVT